MSDVAIYDDETAERPSLEQVNEMKAVLGLPVPSPHCVGVGVECPRCKTLSMESWPYEHCYKCGNRDWVDGSSPSFFRAPNAYEGAIETSARPNDEPYENWSLYDLSNEAVNRGLSKSGGKQALIKRLYEDDEVKTEG